jgi:hypothetical protein
MTSYITSGSSIGVVSGRSCSEANCFTTSLGPIKNVSFVLCVFTDVGVLELTLDFKRFGNTIISRNLDSFTGFLLSFPSFLLGQASCVNNAIA